MKLRSIAAVLAGFAVATAAAPFATAADVQQATATISALPLDGTRSITTATHPVVSLTGAREGMTGTLGVQVVEAARTGNPVIRVKVSATDLLCGAVTVSMKQLSVSNRVGTVNYLTTNEPLGESTLISGSSALGNGSGVSTPADVFLIEGESASVGYTSGVPAHSSTGTLTFVVPDEAPASACAGTLTYDMLYT